MKKITIAVVLMAVVLSVKSSTAMAELTPIRISTSYSTDSDGTSFFNYVIGSEIKNKPWNYTYSNNRIRQRDSAGNFIDETRFVAKWHHPINEETAISAGMGYVNGNNWKFASFNIQYDGVVNYIDHMRFSYNHDSVPTVSAYKDHILGDNLSWSYQQELDKRLILDTSVKYAKFSDGNFRKTLGVTLTKDFSPRYRLGLAYSYDTSDLDKHSVFYLPKGESSLSLVPEVAIPVGRGIFTIMASKPLFSRNINGKINKQTYGVGYHIDNLYIGTQFYHDNNYWSRDFSFNWNNRW